MIRKRRLCHKLNPMCFLWTLILQRIKICVEGWTNIAPYHSLLQPILPSVFYSPSKIYWSLTIEYMLVLNHITHLPQWRGFYHTRLSFWRPGFESRWRLFIFQKKGEIRKFLNEIFVIFVQKYWLNLYWAPWARVSITLTHSCCSIFHCVQCTTMCCASP